MLHKNLVPTLHVHGVVNRVVPFAGNRLVNVLTADSLNLNILNSVDAAGPRDAMSR